MTSSFIKGEESFVETHWVATPGGAISYRRPNMAKKFKTVAGYLRGREQELYVNEIEPNSDAERARERRIINHLLPQLGIAATISDSEKPIDGLDRIRQRTTNEAHLKALNTCRKWLGRMKVVGVSVSVAPPKAGYAATAQI
jgi:hypothetical protein